jgi:hypothetical protein
MIRVLFKFWSFLPLNEPVFIFVPTFYGHFPGGFEQGISCAEQGNLLPELSIARRSFRHDKSDHFGLVKVV